MADSFRGKLQGLTSLVPGMPVFWFNFLDRHLNNMLLNTIVGHTLDSGATSPPLTLSAPLQDFVHEVPLVSFLVASGESSAVQPLLSFIVVSVLAFHEWPSLTSLCFELAQGCSTDKLYYDLLKYLILTTLALAACNHLCVYTVKQSTHVNTSIFFMHICKCINAFSSPTYLTHTHTRSLWAVTDLKLSEAFSSTLAGLLHAASAKGSAEASNAISTQHGSLWINISEVYHLLYADPL